MNCVPVDKGAHTSGEGEVLDERLRSEEALVLIVDVELVQHVQVGVRLVGEEVERLDGVEPVEDLGGHVDEQREPAFVPIRRVPRDREVDVFRAGRFGPVDVRQLPRKCVQGTAERVEGITEPEGPFLHGRLRDDMQTHLNTGRDRLHELRADLPGRVPGVHLVVEGAYCRVAVGELHLGPPAEVDTWHEDSLVVGHAPHFTIRADAADTARGLHHVTSRFLAGAVVREDSTPDHRDTLCKMTDVREIEASVVNDDKSASRMSSAMVRATFLRPRNLLIYGFFTVVVTVFALTWQGLPDLARVAIIVWVVFFVCCVSLVSFVAQRKAYATMLPPGTTIETRYEADRMWMKHPRAEGAFPYATFDRVYRSGGCSVLRVKGLASGFVVVLDELMPEPALVRIEKAIEAAAASARHRPGAALTTNHRHSGALAVVHQDGQRKYCAASRLNGQGRGSCHEMSQMP